MLELKGQCACARKDENLNLARDIKSKIKINEKKRAMKVLMLGWELPPHNSGGLGIACYELCKALAAKDLAIEFIVPYQAEHGIDFMDVTAARPQGVAEVQRAGIAYDSHRYVLADGRTEWLDIY